MDSSKQKNSKNDKSEKEHSEIQDNSEKEQSQSRQLAEKWKRTILKRKIIGNYNYEKEQSGKETILNSENLKQDNSEK